MKFISTIKRKYFGNCCNFIEIFKILKIFVGEVM
jgi:hypothetical protein